MKVLAFDSSSKTLAIAILEDEQLLAEMTINIKKNHSITLMPAIDFLMESLDLKPTDLERIVVAEGPGSYTGLRIAVATAKTLAHTLKISLVGVSSLRILVPESIDGLVIPLMDARRNHVYAGFYENGRAAKADQYASLNAVLEQLKGRKQVTFVGEVTAFRQEINQTFPEAKVLEVLPSAFKIGQVGQKLTPVDVHAFVPKYLKKVEAEENWLKTHEDSGLSYIKRV